MAVPAAWSSSPGGEPLACARDPGRGEGGEAEGLAECEGLPHELPEGDTSRVMKKPLAWRREPFLSGAKAFSPRSQGRWRGTATCARLIRENGEIRFSFHRCWIPWDSRWTLDGGGQVGLRRVDTLAGWSEGV